MTLDALLADARPDLGLSATALRDLDVLGEETARRARRRGRRRLVIGSIVGSFALVAGGLSAAAATGIIRPSWYDAASDWTTQVKTVRL
ncbi:MAG TPA: hypothetical protein VN759_02470, partial [Pseudolysinimonas sp.]|nr:hypothetical protein [Pseudolysinimonas sp.]